MSIFHKYTVTQVLYFVLAIFIVGFLSLSIFGALQVRKIMVHGPIYNEVAKGKDLIAEIFPPTSYISESYINVLELETEKSPECIDSLIEKANALKVIYENSHARWEKEMQKDELYKVFLEDSYFPAMEFFKVRDTLFIPSIKAQRPAKERVFMLHRMKAAFLAHRKSIDKAVTLVTERNEATEAAGAKSVTQTVWIIILFNIFFLSAFTYLYNWVVRAEAENREISAHVDELELAKAELVSKQAQLEICIKELESFSYSVSHDLRAPLRGIDGWSLALLEDYGSLLDAKAVGYLNRVRSETQRMGELIDDLLKLSQLSRAEVKWEKVNLSEMARKVFTRLQEENPNRRVDIIIGPSIETVGDQHLLEIVLTNIISNAWKFSSKVERAEIEFGKKVVNGKKVFFVRDNGAGFNMNSAKNLFGTFERMHKQSEFPGTGIGLAIVKRIISLHQGEVWAESEIQKGATFYFSI